MARATSSLPVPVSPVISTVRACGARRRITLNSSRIAGDRPIMPQTSRRSARIASASSTLLRSWNCLRIAAINARTRGRSSGLAK
jgi:hypothetical protein